MSHGAWSADYGSPWRAPDAAPRRSVDRLALNMGNTLSYFNGGGSGGAKSAGGAGGAAAVAAPRRPSASGRSAGDARSRRLPNTNGDDDDNEEYHDSTPYFSADSTTPTAQQRDARRGGVERAAAGEDAAPRLGSAKPICNGGGAHAAAPPPPLSSALVIRANGAPSCSSSNNNNNASLKDRFAPSIISNGFGGRAADIRPNDESIPPAAERNSVSARAPAPPPPPRNLPVRSCGGGEPPAAPNEVGKLASGAGGGGVGTGIVGETSLAGGGSSSSSASVAQRTRPGCAHALVGIDKELANIISTVEQLSQKANSVAPIAADRGVGGGGAPNGKNGLAAPAPPQLSPRDPNPSNDLANELRSAIEARVKRSVSLKDQSLPASGAAAAAPAAAHRHRRTNSLTQLEDSSGDGGGSGHRQLEQVDSETRSRDRRARLQHMERRREQLLSEVRGGAGADIAPVKEDLCADGEQP